MERQAAHHLGLQKPIRLPLLARRARLPGYYDVMRRAGNGSMSTAVRLVANTEFERRYAAVVGVSIREEVLTPVGLASLEV